MSADADDNESIHTPGEDADSDSEAEESGDSISAASTGSAASSVQDSQDTDGF